MSMQVKDKHSGEAVHPESRGLSQAHLFGNIQHCKANKYDLACFEGSASKFCWFTGDTIDKNVLCDKEGQFQTIANI